MVVSWSRVLLFILEAAAYEIAKLVVSWSGVLLLILFGVGGTLLLYYMRKGQKKEISALRSILTVFCSLMALPFSFFLLYLSGSPLMLVLALPISFFLFFELLSRTRSKSVLLWLVSVILPLFLLWVVPRLVVLQMRSLTRAFVAHDMEILQEALEKYKVDHGKYPESLDKLLKDYIDHLPIDPFNPHKVTYGYEAESWSLFRWVLRSYGPDKDEDINLKLFRFPIDSSERMLFLQSQQIYDSMRDQRSISLWPSSGDIVLFGEISEPR